MLWIALNFQQLALDSFPQASASVEPWAVTEGPRVMVCNAQARVRGVRAGMSVSAALALAPGLSYRARDPATEAAALEQIAAWAGQFTPSVSLQPPCGLLLEIEGSLGLLGGIEHVLATISSGTAEMGYACTLGCAPTPACAWLLARAGSEKIVTCRRMIEAGVAPLPLAALDCGEQTYEILGAIGARTVGDLLRLPRAGLARRCGQRLLDLLDRIVGTLPEARRFHVPAASFAATLELGADVTHAEALLFAARRLLTQFTGYLAARSSGIQRFSLVLLHEAQPPTELAIGLATPTREPDRLMTLVRERLSSHRLVAPVCRLRLEAGDILELAGETGGLFADRTNAAGDWARLVERLQARLGAAAVQRLMPRDSHRPEQAWQAAAPGVKSMRVAHKPRPLWLLQQPCALGETASTLHYGNSPLALIAGPERIEAGWWDTHAVRRDYFIAQTPDRSTLWIYRERSQPGRWYVHGIFG